MAQRLAFAGVELPADSVVQPGFQRQRMMEQRHQPQSIPPRGGDRRHGAQRQTVDDRQHPLRQRGQYLVGLAQRRWSRLRKTGIEPPEFDPPAQRRQSGHDPPVVQIAAGAGIGIAGN